MKTVNSKDYSDLIVLSKILDSQFKLPFGIKVGWDGIIGLIPIVGDMTTTILSSYIIFRSAMLGSSPPVLLRMGLNVVIDNIVSSVPVIGNLFDFIWKSNLKNIHLLEKYMNQPQQTTGKSWALLGLIFLLIFMSIIGVIAVGVIVGQYLFQLITSL